MKEVNAKVTVSRFDGSNEMIGVIFHAISVNQDVNIQHENGLLTLGKVTSIRILTDKSAGIYTEISNFVLNSMENDIKDIIGDKYDR